MKQWNKIAGASGFITLAALGANPAFAAGTTAGSSIVNNVTVDFKVGGVSQTQKTASDTLVVDRKINLTVAEVGTATTSVSPGEISAVTTFTVTNTSNAALDFALDVVQQVGGAGAHSNTDNFDATNVKIYVDTDLSGTYTAGDTLVTYLDQVLADASKTVFVVVDIPVDRVTSDVAAVTLTATAKAGDTAGLGADLTETTGVNTTSMDTVFADAAGATDGARDAAHSAKDDYTVSAAALTATKTSLIISDPVIGALSATNFPKAIPGATIRYCIAVTNATGSATATNVTINDPLPTTVTYVASSILLGGTVTSGVCNTDGTAGGTFASNTVSGTIASVAAGETKTLVFQATIQ
jgi:uncharacterized repeat protein (TIGR01451 family)